MRRFAFLVHPRDAEDLKGVERSLTRAEFSRISDEWCPFEYARIDYGGASGRVVVVPLTAAQMEGLPRSFVRAKVLEAADFASRQGAQVIGLGAMTSVATRSGRWLCDQVPALISNGNAYTAAVVAEQVRRVIGDSLSAQRVAIVGGSGSVGLGCAKLLAPAAGSMLLVGRFRPSLKRACAGLHGAVDVSTRLDSVRSADVVILATSASEPLLFSDDLRDGVTVFDVSEPSNLSKDCLARARAGRIRVLRSGLVRVPGVELQRVDPSLPAQCVHACLGEALLHALEDRFDAHSVGAPEVEPMRVLAAAARRWGIEPRLEPRGADLVPAVA